MDASAFPAQGIGYRDILARVNPAVSEASLPIVQQFATTPLLLPVAQTVSPSETPTFQAETILQVPNGLPTWLESSPSGEPRPTL